jgi:hypothetical protein
MAHQQNINVENILSSFSPETKSALENHFKGSFLATMTSAIGMSAPKAAVAAVEEVQAPAKRGPGRPPKAAVVVPTKKGPGRPAGSKNKKGKKAAAKSEPTARATGKNGLTASETIRRYDAKHADAAVADVVAYCAKQNLEVAPALVYNVRANLKKAAAKSKKTTKK